MSEETKARAVSGSSHLLVTPDGRYIVVRGRLWRATNPSLPEEEKQKLVDALMNARRGVKEAKGAKAAVADARRRVNEAKIALGERGPVWWDDGAERPGNRTDFHANYSRISIRQKAPLGRSS